MHKLPLRIYYEDTDAQGIVYHSKYLNFFERARAECLREIGYRQEELLKEDIAFVVKKQEIEYFSPAKLDDEIVIKTILSLQKMFLLHSPNRQTLKMMRSKFFVKDRFTVAVFL